jgi:hypothetical protein
MQRCPSSTRRGTRGRMPARRGAPRQRRPHRSHACCAGRSRWGLARKQHFRSTWWRNIKVNSFTGRGGSTTKITTSRAQRRAKLCAPPAQNGRSATERAWTSGPRSRIRQTERSTSASCRPGACAPACAAAWSSGPRSASERRGPPSSRSTTTRSRAPVVHPRARTAQISARSLRRRRSRHRRRRRSRRRPTTRKHRCRPPRGPTSSRPSSGGRSHRGSMALQRPPALLREISHAP